MQTADPRLAYYVMLPARDMVHSFSRALSMVANGLIPARLLANLQIWGGPGAANAMRERLTRSKESRGER